MGQPDEPLGRGKPLASPRVLLLVLVVLGHVWSRVSIVRWIEDILWSKFTQYYSSDHLVTVWQNHS